MDAIPPLLSPHPTPTVRHNIFYYIAAFILLAAVLGATLWYEKQNKQQTGPVFDPKTQFIPKGAVSLEVDQSLAAFGFPKPLPFFDKRNVVQSLSQPQATDTIFIHAQGSSQPPVIISLNYQIPGRDVLSVRDAFLSYFMDMGWRENRNTNPESANPAQDSFSLSFRHPTSLHTIRILLVSVQDGSFVSLAYLPPFPRPSLTAPQ